MKHIDKCEHCGRFSRAYTARLNRGMVSVLKRILDLYEVEKRAIILDKDLQLSYSQNCNTQKMKHLGLIRYIDGGWKPTEKARRFVREGLEIQDCAVHMDNMTLVEDHPAYEGVKIKLVTFNSYFPSEYSKKQDYLNGDN